MKTIKCRYIAIFACLSFFLFSGIEEARGGDSVKNVEITESEITVDHKQLPFVAYLHIALKNNGDKKVSNLTLRISYYDEENHLIHKAVVKNALNEAIPPKETREYKIRLSGDYFNSKNEQYPYSRPNEVDEFDVEILNVALASK
jgi:hypothetical protein